MLILNYGKKKSIDRGCSSKYKNEMVDKETSLKYNRTRKIMLERQNMANGGSARAYIRHRYNSFSISVIPLRTFHFGSKRSKVRAFEIS